ncbi:MAG: hypothetical protein Q4B82_00435 [Alysiella sp.]|uniref:hypothetical protein n=1 Tax=Alysiella sp. TaxID=1872483 RepID=UPI0026DC41EA|nr:hypothetical protein [Alysiella sp.]MDO4433035.1 hypothetical protein [Alysiella sp.]
MARKKKNDDGVVGGILLIVLIVAIIATPILLAWGYFSAKEKLDSADENDFWLNEAEQDEFVQLLKKQQHFQKNIHSAHQLAQQHQVKTNKDGSYSQRSNVGKQVVATLGQYEPLLFQTNHELEKLVTLPQQRWEKVNAAAKNFSACKWGGIAWIGSFIILSIWAYLQPSTSSQEASISGSLFSGAFGAAIFSGVVYGITYWLNKGITEFISYPPKVTIQNYQNNNI